MNRNTAIFLMLALALAGYTVWEYKNAAMHSGDSAQEKRLFFFVPDQVESFDLIRGADTVSVVREGEEWKMKKPVEDATEKSAVEAFLYSVMIQKGKIFREPGDHTSLKDFGLDPPGSSIQIRQKKSTESLDVSSKNAYDGSYYIRQGDEVMLGDHGLAQIVGRDPNSLRSRHLWRDRDSIVQSVHAEVNLGKVVDKYTVQKDGDQWMLEPKPGFAVDSHKIEQWLMALHGLTPNEFAGEFLGEDEKRNFLLLKPSFAAQVQLQNPEGKASEWDLTIGQDRADDVFLFTNQRATIYKTQSPSLAAIRVGREFFRDGKAAFKFPVEQAHEILTNGHLVKKDGSEWKLADATAGMELNPDKLSTLLQNLTSLEAQEFPAAGSTKGFKANQQIQIRDSKGQMLFEMSWGDTFPGRQSWNKGMTFRFVKTNLSKEVLGVNAAKIAILADAGLVITKAANKKTDKK